MAMPIDTLTKTI